MSYSCVKKSNEKPLLPLVIYFVPWCLSLEWRTEVLCPHVKFTSPSKVAQNVARLPGVCPALAKVKIVLVSKCHCAKKFLCQKILVSSWPPSKVAQDVARPTNKNFLVSKFTCVKISLCQNILVSKFTCVKISFCQNFLGSIVKFTSTRTGSGCHSGSVKQPCLGQSPKSPLPYSHLTSQMTCTSCVSSW